MNTEECYISLLDKDTHRVFNDKMTFEEAEMAKFNAEDRREYEDSLKAYRDIKNSIDTALEQGREEGRAEGLEKGLKKGRAEGRAEGENRKALEIAQNLLSLKMPIEAIVQATGLTAEEIQSLT